MPQEDNADAVDHPEQTGLVPLHEDSPNVCPPIVAIGASAGGLEAIESFFSTVMTPNARAYIIVQHLSPDFKSLMAELLGRRTTLEVRQAVHGEAVQPGHIYLLPPGKTMIIADGVLHLADRDAREMLHLPIDEFFTSLAADQGRNAIGVILSGSGNDGSRGTRAIIRAGGRVLVQSPDSAKFPSMPKAAIEAGANKEILQPAEMSQAIEGGEGSVPMKLHGHMADKNGLPARLLNAIQRTFGLDLADYKPSTVQRRISRRMGSRGFDTLDDYADFVAGDPEEQEWLYYDLLIGVTSFFRDTEAFEQLRLQIVPKLVELAERDEEVRIWVPACATGEEAYSIAIMLHEQIRETGHDIPIRIFATDIHRRSLAIAAAGIYSEEALSGMPASMVERHFIERNGQYHIKPAIRRMLIFSPHDILKDPPFTKLDLVSCRNFLIYLQPDAQKRVLTTFSYALNKGGFLFLGPSESLLDLDRDFDELDKPWRIFRKTRSHAVPASVDPAQSSMDRNPANAATALAPRMVPTARRDQRLALAYEALLDRYVPPSALIDGKGNLIHSFGDATPFLSFRAGKASLSIHDLIDENLKTPLQSAVSRAKRTGKPVQLSQIPCANTPGQVLGKLHVEPIFLRQEGQTYLLVSFDQSELKDEIEPLRLETDLDNRGRIEELERDLRFTEENLQSTIEELETSNEELQASNEELMASNEELQSTNEELHSVNEELHTVSAEHQRKIEQLTDLSHDMDNLLSSTDVAAVFVDDSLHIRRYTPAITGIFNLMPHDLGRPIEHVTHQLDLQTLIPDIRRVIQSGTAELFEVKAGKTDLRMDIRPYRDFEGHVAGAALSFVDITDYRRAGSSVKKRQVRDIDHFARTLASLSSANSHQDFLNGLFRGLLPLSMPVQRTAACDLSAILERACQDAKVKLERGSRLPLLQRDSGPLEWIFATIAKMAAAQQNDQSSLMVSANDEGECWRINLQFSAAKAKSSFTPFHDAALEMIEAVADRLSARMRARTDGVILEFEKMRGDHLIISKGIATAKDHDAEAQANPKLAKSQ